MMLNSSFKKVAIGAVAIATVIAVPVVAQAKHTPIHQRAAGVAYRHAPSESFVPALRRHSPNPAWDVYSPSPGRAVASQWHEPPYMSFQEQQLVTGD
jgi:hypothetical protein